MRRGWLAVWVCAAAAGQPGVQRTAGDVSAPRVIERHEPEYTEEARIARLEGTIVLTIAVTPEGRVTDARVIRPLGLGLEDKAVDCVNEWRFQPAVKDGKAVRVPATVQIFFRLLPDPRAWHLERVYFETRERASRPVLLKAGYPAPSGAEENAAVTVSFDVDERGNPENVQARQSSDPKWDNEVIALVQQWRFKPGEQNGVPVPARCTMHFVRGSHSPIPPPGR
jgi:TonB family protein